MKGHNIPYIPYFYWYTVDNIGHRNYYYYFFFMTEQERKILSSKVSLKMRWLVSLKNLPL